MPSSILLACEVRPQQWSCNEVVDQAGYDGDNDQEEHDCKCNHNDLVPHKPPCQTCHLPPCTLCGAPECIELSVHYKQLLPLCTEHLCSLLANVDRLVGLPIDAIEDLKTVLLRLEHWLKLPIQYSKVQCSAVQCSAVDWVRG